MPVYTFHYGLLQTKSLAMLHSNVCVLCPAVVLLHHWTVVLHTLLVCTSHVHECISVDHVYSIQNECTVTAMLLSLIAYWTTLCLSTRWVGLTEGALQCWDSHCTCVAFLFSNGPAGKWNIQGPMSTYICFSVYVCKTCLLCGAMYSRNTMYLASVAYSITTFLKHEWQKGVSKPYGSCWEEFQKVRQKMEINLRRAWSGKPRPKFHCTA